jgi:hypothetical protein
MTGVLQPRAKHKRARAKINKLRFGICQLARYDGARRLGSIEISSDKDSEIFRAADADGRALGCFLTLKDACRAIDNAAQAAERRHD